MSKPPTKQAREETREAVGVEAVPEPAAEAVAAYKWECEFLVSKSRSVPWSEASVDEVLAYRAAAERHIEAALPHLQKQFRDQLLSDEAVIAMAKRTHPLLAQYKESEVEMIFAFKRADLEAALKATPTATEEAGS